MSFDLFPATINYELPTINKQISVCDDLNLKFKGSTSHLRVQVVVFKYVHESYS